MPSESSLVVPQSSISQTNSITQTNSVAATDDGQEVEVRSSRPSDVEWEEFHAVASTVSRRSSRRAAEPLTMVTMNFRCPDGQLALSKQFALMQDARDVYNKAFSLQKDKGRRFHPSIEGPGVSMELGPNSDAFGQSLSDLGFQHEQTYEIVERKSG